MALNDSNFYINNFLFSVPPTGISFLNNGNIFTYETMKNTKSSVYRPGNGTLTMQVSIMIPGPDSHLVINSTLLPLVKWVSVYPFVQIRNEMVGNITQKGASIWCWRSMAINTGAPLPPTSVGVDLSFDYTAIEALTGLNVPTFKVKFNNPETASAWNSSTGLEVPKKQGILFPDGENTFREVSFGEIYANTPVSETTSDISESEGYRIYLDNLTHNSFLLAEVPQQEISFHSTLISPATLPPDAWPPESGKVKGTPVKWGSALDTSGNFYDPTDSNSQSGAGSKIIRIAPDEFSGIRKAKWASFVKTEALANKLPEELLYAMMQPESDFDENAISESGCTGLFQVSAKTGRLWGFKNVQAIGNLAQRKASNGSPYSVSGGRLIHGVMASNSNAAKFLEKMRAAGDERLNGPLQIKIVAKKMREYLDSNKGHILSSLHDWESKEKQLTIFQRSFPGSTHIDPYGNAASYGDNF